MTLRVFRCFRVGDAKGCDCFGEMVDILEDVFEVNVEEARMPGDTTR